MHLVQTVGFLSVGESFTNLGRAVSALEIQVAANSSPYLHIALNQLKINIDFFGQVKVQLILFEDNMKVFVSELCLVSASLLFGQFLVDEF